MSFVIEKAEWPKSQFCSKYEELIEAIKVCAEGDCIRVHVEPQYSIDAVVTGIHQHARARGLKVKTKRDTLARHIYIKLLK